MERNLNSSSEEKNIREQVPLHVDPKVQRAVPRGEINPLKNGLNTINLQKEKRGNNKLK